MNAFARWMKRRQTERDLAEEMAEHLREKIAGLIEEGLKEEEARERALRQFGNMTALKERSREAWGWNEAEQTAGDLRFAFRGLGKSPAFTLTAVAVLALGIGLNTAMFSAVKAVLLAQLPYPEPEKVVQLWQTTTSGGDTVRVSGPDYRDWRDQNRSMEHMAAYGRDLATLSGDFQARRIRVSIVSNGFFQTLGVSPVAGRIFTPKESVRGGPALALLSSALARSAFGTENAALGRVVRIDGMAFTVVGVMPDGFDFPDRTQAWIPLEVVAHDSARSAHNFDVIGRLKTGFSIKEAQADLDVVGARLAKAYADDKDRGIRVVSLHDQVVGPVRQPMLMLLAAVGCVLLIACVNIANLQLARGTARAKEMSVRTALGAGRGRLARQLLTESLLLAGTGGAAGILLAEAAISVLQAAVPANIPRIETIKVDAGVLGFTLALSVAAGLLFGVLPAFTASRVNAGDALKEGPGRGTSGPRTRKIGSALVVVEVAMAMVLLVGAGLLLKSYWKLEHVDPGFRDSGVYTADLSWPAIKGGKIDGELVLSLSRKVLEAVRAAPGLEAAGIVNSLPVRDSGADGWFEIEGVPLPHDPHDNLDAWYRLASPGYFEAMGIRLLEGRWFNQHDQPKGAQIALVNQSFAAKFFPQTDPIGKRIRFLGFDEKPQFMTIVGVVSDVRALGLARPPDAEVFAHYFQHTADSWLDVTLVIRGPGAGSPRIAQIVQAVNRDTPVELQALKEVISETIARQRFETALLGVFAGLALLLAGIGIYGVLSYTVARRTSEIGIRMALGANRANVLLLILREGCTLAGAGLALGTALALLVTRALSTMLFGVGAADPTAFAEVAAVFAAVALLACYLPARQAVKIDPNVALRNE
jgi:predicted permease